MQTSAYTRSVFKTLSIKPAKVGLRQVARKTQTTNIAHAIVGLKSETGELLQGLRRYLVGFQLTDAERQNAAEELGDIGYYMAVLARSLKMKLPGASKKLLLKTLTITEAVLTLDSISTDLLDQYKKTFYGRELDIEKIQQIFAPMVELYFQTCYALLHTTPSTVWGGNIAKLSQRYPAGFFDVDAQEQRHKPTELAAMEQAMQSEPENV